MDIGAGKVGITTPGLTHLFEHQGCVFRCRDGTNDEDVVRSVFEGEYTLPDHSQYEPNSVSLDIGAHIGAYGLWACQRYAGLRVIYVEPLQENVDLLFENVARNSDKDSLIEHAAVGEGVVRTITYPDENTEFGHRHRFIGCGKNMTMGVHTIQAKVLQLRDLFTLAWFRWQIAKFWTVKLDCEGGEYGLLEGSSAAALKRVKWFVGEHHDGEDRIRAVLEGCGFLRHAPKAANLFLYENPVPFAQL